MLQSAPYRRRYMPPRVVMGLTILFAALVIYLTTGVDIVAVAVALIGVWFIYLEWSDRNRSK